MSDQRPQSYERPACVSKSSVSVSEAFCTDPEPICFTQWKEKMLGRPQPVSVRSANRSHAEAQIQRLTDASGPVQNSDDNWMPSVVQCRRQIQGREPLGLVGIQTHTGSTLSPSRFRAACELHLIRYGFDQLRI